MPPTADRRARPDPAWDIEGPGDAPILVFIHGTRVTRTSWRAVVGRLSDEFRCVSVDLPGHGARAGEPFTLEAATDAVGAAIDAAGGGRAVLVGLSLGGYVAMATAGRQPARVGGLVLAGCSAEPSGRVAVVFRLYAWVLGVVPQGPLDALNSWWFRRRYPSDIAEPIVAAGYWSRGGAAAIRAIARTTFRDRLLAFGGPTLVINGDLDVIFRLGARSFLHDIPGIRCRTLRWATHLSPLDRPDAFAAEVRAFAASLPA